MQAELPVAENQNTALSALPEPDVNELIALIGDMRLATRDEIRAKIYDVQDYLLANCPEITQEELQLEHFIAPGLYGRKITIPKGMLATGVIHRHIHFFILLQGEMSILSPEEGMTRLKAPYFGVHPAGTKRLVYTHEDTVVANVHVGISDSIEENEARMIATCYADVEAIGFLTEEKKE